TEGVVGPQSPMVGSFLGCCARAAGGCAAKAPPRSMMKSRRLMSATGLPLAWRRQPLYRTLHLLQKNRQVLGADLNCSSSRWALPNLLLCCCQTVAHTGVGSPLHCGMSVPSMSALGQSRPM